MFRKLKFPKDEFWGHHTLYEFCMNSADSEIPGTPYLIIDIHLANGVDLKKRKGDGSIFRPSSPAPAGN
jgi:hypothetical protein